MNSHRVGKQFALPTTSLGWCPFVWWGAHVLCHLVVGKSIVVWRCVKRGRVTVWISIWIKKIKRWEKWKGKLGGILMVSLTRKVNISIPMSKCSLWRVGCHQTASAWFRELSLGSTALEVCVPGSSHSTALSKISPTRTWRDTPREKESTVIWWKRFCVSSCSGLIHVLISMSFLI